MSSHRSFAWIENVGRFAAILDLESLLAGREAESSPAAAPLRFSRETHVHFSRDRRIAVAGVLRIDNRAELCRELELRPRSDAELLIAAYGRWGEDCFARLLGDFSFVLYDRSRERTLCARDQAGVRQLYYAETHGLFAFSDSAEALLAAPGVPAEPDPEALALSLAGRFPAEDRTLYAGIRRLPPGCFLTAGPDGIRVRRFHDWAAVPLQRYRGRAEATERFRELFADAVRCRLEPKQTTGATLSGGLDSASIVCMARAARPECDLKAYSLVFPGLPCDESRFVQHVSDSSRVPVERLVPGLESLEPSYPGVPADPTFSMLFGLLERASGQGVRSILWGVGGDELLTSGTAYITDLIRRREYCGALETVRERAQYYRANPVRLGFNACIRPFLPDRLRRIWRSVRPEPKPAWLRLHVPAPATPRLPFHSATRAGLYFSLRSGRAVEYTLPGLDALASALSLDFRYPFFDRRLLEFGLSLPMEHSALLASKLVLRDAMDGILPDSIRLRLDKAGFDAFVNNELRGRHADIIASFIRDSELVERGIVSPAPLIRTFENYLASQAGSGGNQIAAFVRTESWLRALRRSRRGHNGELFEPADFRQEAVFDS